MGLWGGSGTGVRVEDVPWLAGGNREHEVVLHVLRSLAELMGYWIYALKKLRRRL